MSKLNPDEAFMKQLFEMSKTAKGKTKEDVEQIQKEIGIKIVMKLGTNLHEIRDELIEFVSIYEEIPKEEAEKVNIVDFVKKVMQDEDLKSFLKKQTIPK